MRRRRLVVPGLWVVAVAAVGTAFGAWTGAVPVAEPPLVDAAVAPAAEPVARADVDSSVVSLRQRDPFRLKREPTNVPFGSEPPAAVAPDAPRPPRPRLAVTGLAGGPPWTAVVEGVPGYENGLLMLMDEVAAGLRLDSVRGDTAFLSGFDTTWVLVLKRPRQ